MLSKYWCHQVSCNCSVCPNEIRWISFNENSVLSTIACVEKSSELKVHLESSCEIEVHKLNVLDSISVRERVSCCPHVPALGGAAQKGTHHDVSVGHVRVKANGEPCPVRS